MPVPRQKKFPAHFDVSGSLYLSHIDISNQQTEGNGGTIAMSAGAAGGRETIIEGSRFAGNQAAKGGALSIETGRVTVSGTAFESNVAQQNGGAVYVQADGQLVVQGVTFITNNAAQLGGAIFIETQTPGAPAAALTILQPVSFSGNIANSGEALFDLNTRSPFTNDEGDKAVPKDAVTAFPPVGHRRA